MRLLLHLCCGPCAAFPVKFLRENNYNIIGYFYNPNIHPYKEFKQRLDTLKAYAAQVDLSLTVDSSYSLEEFLTEALREGSARCSTCYELRLRQTATVAKEQAFDGFTTTLLVSPYQKHELIKEIGKKIAKEIRIEFCYFDFRTGWQEGVNLSRNMELYRHPYCGCIFSEKERYCKKSNKE